MITQAYISKSLAGLNFRKVYGLTKYVDSMKPVAVFGMYREEDFDMLWNHCQLVAPAIVIWQGMDAKEIPEGKLLVLKSMPHVKHYVISHWGQRSLKKQGIESILLPISATKPKIDLHPRGDSIYIYSSDLSKESGKYHGDNFIEAIKERTGLNVIRATLKSYDKKELKEIYKQCFINLRLTRYDGCPNTNLEMGLMGRRSIFNGRIPHSIKWKKIDDICESIMKEYESRHEDNSQIAKDIFQYINIGKQFLKI